MPAPLPTRRAVRPDSKHYRMARRQRLRRSVKSDPARGLVLLAVTLAGALVALRPGIAMKIVASIVLVVGYGTSIMLRKVRRH